MAKHFGTCGHEIDEGIVASIESYDREGRKCASYGTYCAKCFYGYYKDGIVLNGELKKLVKLIEKRGKIVEKFTFFWSGEFSQWHQCPIQIDGKTYNCTEQYMMAEKARLFKDAGAYGRIMSAVDPSDQKRFGRQVQNFDKEVWERHAKEIVYKANWAKFTQNQNLKNKLLATKGTTLVEASLYDNIWGIGLKSSDPRAKDRKKWRGTNWLGEILTKVRENIINSES